MEYGPPPLFNQGVSARARLAFFSFLAVVFIVVDARVKALESIRTGVSVALYPFEQMMLLPGAGLERVGQYFTSVSQLQRENQQLRLAQLGQAYELQQFAQLQAENEQLRKLIDLKARTSAPTVLAEVSYEAQDRFFRKLVIGKGTQESVQAGQPVLDALGVVGQVTRVFSHSAEVTLLTDKDQSLSVQVLRNGLRGVVFGSPQAGTLDLRFMAANADIVNGDQLVTSGLDGVYPAGLPVARVIRVERSAKDQFARISAEPAAGVHQNSFVVVLQVDPQAAPTPPRVEAANSRRSTKGGRDGREMREGREPTGTTGAKGTKK